MYAIFKREIRSFFASPIGYMILGLFLVLSALFLWVFKGPYNIFDYGFADLGNFFRLAPWVFLFLIPAITMRSFAEERKLGTLELLLIRPLSLWQIVLGKFLGTLVLVLLALLPTLLYVVTVSQLGTTVGNMDMGLVIGSYFGIIFLVATYTAVGLWASALSDNQIVAFLAGALVCFLLYYGFSAMATLFDEGALAVGIRNWGMEAHYESIAGGVLDTRDLVYYVSVSVFFLWATVRLLPLKRNR